MRLDFYALNGWDFGLGSEVLPLRGVLPGFEFGRDAKTGKGVPEVGPFLTVGLSMDVGVAFGRGRWFWEIGVVGPEHFEGLEIFGIFVPVAEAELIDVQEVADF